MLQWRIHDFPGGAPISKGSANLLFENCTNYGEAETEYDKHRTTCLFDMLLMNQSFINTR